MKILSESFSDGERMPSKFAFAKKDLSEGLCFARNVNPEIAWQDIPPATRSLVLICKDRHVPVDLTQVNLAGVIIPESALRRDFHHWVVADIQPGIKRIPEGSVSKCVTVGGKSSQHHNGFIEGLNDYTKVLGEDQTMAGHYFGYDGPSPPLNDKKLHWYEFTLYALSIPTLGLEGAFSADDVIPLLQRHCLDSASIAASYSYSPEVELT